MLSTPDAARRPLPRAETVAAWLLVLPILTEGVFPGVVRVELVGIAMAAFARVVLSHDPLPYLGPERAAAVLSVLALTACGYAVLGTWPAAGSAAAYDSRAVTWAVTYGAVVVYAALLWDLDVLTAVMWRGCVIALWIGVVACAVSRATGLVWLVNPDAGGLRMTGTLTEPSDWAPILAVIFLLALRRRSWLNAALAIVGLYLADSPTCMLVMAVSVALYAALTGTWRARLALLATLAVLVPAGAVLATTAREQQYLNSSDPAEIAVGRLIRGVQAAADGKDDGTANSRYANTAFSLGIIRQNGWAGMGAGPGADTAWYAAAYPPPDVAPGAVNALWVDVLWNFGEWGIAALAVLTATAVWRMRKSPLTCSLLLPFCVASMVNSSIPDWSVTALAVLAVGLGWSFSGNSGYSPAPEAALKEPVAWLTRARRGPGEVLDTFLTQTR